MAEWNEKRTSELLKRNGGEHLLANVERVHPAAHVVLHDLRLHDVHSDLQHSGLVLT